MAELKKSHLEKIVSFLSKSNRKYLSLEDLSKAVGIFPEILGEELTYFEPMILMDNSLNMRALLGPIQSYLAEQEAKKAQSPSPVRVVASNKELAAYPTIASFVYAKMAFAGGLIDPSSKLSDHDLHLLQKLVSREVKARKGKKAKRN
jgi:hypothetical protein